MLTILADALMTASRQNGSKDHLTDRSWERRILSDERRREHEQRRYRFSRYRDLW